MDSRCNKFVLIVCGYLFLSYRAFAGTITLSTDIDLPALAPDPNDEITVWLHSDVPLLFMNMLIRVNGDAAVTAVMNETDCNDFGWNSDFTPVSTINPDNSIQIFGLNWNNNYNGTIGYLKFRCNSGQVSVYIDTENSPAFSWSEDFTCSTEPIVVGSLTLPPIIEPNRPEPVLMQSPAGSSGPPRGEPNSIPEWPQRFEILEMLDSEPSIIEINSDITTNQVWDANNVYYITARTVNVQALLVIEPGTTVIFAYQAELCVNNGGTLISKGTPDKLIIYTPDFVHFTHPEYPGYYWQLLPPYGPRYYCPIHIQDTASPATTVRYCMIEGAVGGIITDNIRLNEPIENNYIFGNSWGIYEYGPALTDVRNNLCFYQDYAAIEIQLCPDPNGFADLDHGTQIEHNTCDGSDYTYCGIIVHGIADPNRSGVPTVYLTNNIVTSNYNYGLNLVDGAMYALVANTGYYGNGFDRNWEFDEYNPVTTESNPYYSYTNEKPYWHHHLTEGSDFIDAGTQYIEQTTFIGTTTNFDGLPDKDIVDLGFHHTDWDFVGGGGIAGSDIDDLIEISEYWLCSDLYDPNSPGYDPGIFDPNSPNYISDPNLITFGGDRTGDGYVDLADFEILSGLWQAGPYEPHITPILSFDVDTGWLNISVAEYDSSIVSVRAYIDGTYVGNVYLYGNEFPLSVDVSSAGNKPQHLKFAVVDSEGHFTWTPPTEFCYTSPLSYCIVPSVYEPNEPIPFSAYTTDTGDSTVKVCGLDGEVVWSQSFTGNTISGYIPASVENSLGVHFVKFEPPAGTAITKITVKDPHPFTAPDPNVTGMIVVGGLEVLFSEIRTVDAVEQAFKERGIKYRMAVGPYSLWSAIAKYAPQLKYLYISSHGGWAMTLGPDGVLRTFVELADGPCVSAKASDFTGTPPIWCADPLPGYLETSFAKSFASMGFRRLKFFYNDSCFGGHLSIGRYGNLVEGREGQGGILDPLTQNDMSLACGMTDSQEDRFYMGWFDESESLWKPQEETSYQIFGRALWTAMGQGKNLYDAILKAVNDVIMTSGEEKALEEYRIKGQTYIWGVRLNAH